MRTHRGPGRRHRRWFAAGALSLLLSLGCSGQSPNGNPLPPPSPGVPPPPLPPPGSPPTVTVTVDTTIRYQQMSGWEVTGSIGQVDFTSTPWGAEAIERAVNEVGVNRVRLELWSGTERPDDVHAQYQSGALTYDQWRAVRFVAVNDNNDPNVANPAGYQWSMLDDAVERVVLPMRQAMAARGEQLIVNLNYISFGQATQHVHADPAEYAELLLAAFVRLRDRYGIVPELVETILEPDNTAIWTGPQIGAAVAAAGARLAAAGFRPEFIAPSTTDLRNAVPRFNQAFAVPGASGYLRELSYHRYRGVTDANLRAVGTRGAETGMRTAMLEHIGSDADDLYKDLTLANVSAWQQYTIAYPTNDDGAQLYLVENNRPVMASRTPGLRQYFRHVRLGALRVHGASTAAEVRPVAFTNTGGGPVVVLHVDTPETIAIRGLRAGRYLVSTSRLGGTGALGTVTADASGQLQLTVDQSAIVTVAWQP